MVNLNLLIASRNELDRIIWFNPTAIFRFIIFTAYAVTYSFIKGFGWLRLEKVKSETERIRASLNNLRTQIEPHFIFNSLNSVYALSLEEGAKKTSETIEELSGLFHYSLNESNVSKVSIKDELNFIEKYIHLHRIRIQENDKIKVDTAISWDKKPAQIAPLLIVNFIENAFKYGISLKKTSFVDIQISVINMELVLRIKNTMHAENNSGRNGLGLLNTRQRLDLLYQGNYSLQESQDDTMHSIVLNINLA